MRAAPKGAAHEAMQMAFAATDERAKIPRKTDKSRDATASCAVARDRIWFATGKNGIDISDDLLEESSEEVVQKIDQSCLGGYNMKKLSILSAIMPVFSSALKPYLELNG